MLTNTVVYTTITESEWRRRSQEAPLAYTLNGQDRQTEKGVPKHPDLFPWHADRSWNHWHQTQQDHAQPKAIKLLYDLLLSQALCRSAFATQTSIQISVAVCLCQGKVVRVTIWFEAMLLFPCAANTFALAEELMETLYLASSVRAWRLKIW